MGAATLKVMKSGKNKLVEQSRRGRICKLNPCSTSHMSGQAAGATTLYRHVVCPPDMTTSPLLEFHSNVSAGSCQQARSTTGNLPG